MQPEELSKGESVKKFILPLIAIILTACGAPVHTAESVENIRWETSLAEPTTEAQPLDCSWVDECLEVDRGLEAHVLVESKEEIYVWTTRYSFLNPEAVVLFIVVNRPDENTWDKLGLEYIDSQWQVGVYEGIKKVGNVLIDDWEYVPAGFDPDEDQTIAIGMADESWAVIVRPTSATTFQYSIEEFYWK